MDRTEIGNCIISGISEYGGVLNQMSEVVTRLELAGWVIVPREPTTEMIADGQAAWRNDPLKRSTTLYKAMIDAAVAHS